MNIVNMPIEAGIPEKRKLLGLPYVYKLIVTNSKGLKQTFEHEHDVEIFFPCSVQANELIDGQYRFVETRIVNHSEGNPFLYEVTIPTEHFSWSVGVTSNMVRRFEVICHREFINFG